MMNNENAVNEMIIAVENIIRSNNEDKYNIDNNKNKKEIVKAILDKLEEVVKNEDQES